MRRIVLFVILIAFLMPVCSCNRSFICKTGDKKDGFTVRMKDIFGDKNNTYFLIQVYLPFDISDAVIGDIIVNGDLSGGYSWSKIGSDTIAQTYLVIISSNCNGKNIRLRILGFNSTKNPMEHISTEEWSFSGRIEYDNSTVKQINITSECVDSITICDSMVIVSQNNEACKGIFKTALFFDNEGGLVRPIADSTTAKGCYFVDAYYVFDSTSIIANIQIDDEIYKIKDHDLR